MTEPYPTFDLPDFRQQLAETVAWCSARVPLGWLDDWRERRSGPASSGAGDGSYQASDLLRSPALRPQSFRNIDPWRREVEERRRIVRELARERARLLRTEGRCSAAPGDLAGGRLLIYDPDSNLCDGAACTETAGFFDVDNMAPWDTWICYVQTSDWGTEPWKPFLSFLVSWVPPELIEVAAAGLEVNPEECVVWANDVDTPFTRQLDAAGLLIAPHSRRYGDAESPS